MNYGKALRIVRAARNLTQKELAQKASLDSNYVSLIELGKRSPSEKSVRAITGALGIPQYLFLLLASDAGDLRAISTDQATALGRALLDVLFNSELQTPK